MDHSRACHWLCRWGQHGTADPDDCGPATDCPFPFSRSAGGEPNRNFRIRPPCSRWARQREDDDDWFGGGHREPDVYGQPHGCGETAGNPPGSSHQVVIKSLSRTTCSYALSVLSAVFHAMYWTSSVLRRTISFSLAAVRSIVRSALVTNQCRTMCGGARIAAARSAGLQSSLRNIRGVSGSPRDVQN